MSTPSRNTPIASMPLSDKAHYGCEIRHALELQLRAPRAKKLPVLLSRLYDDAGLCIANPEKKDAAGLEAVLHFLETIHSWAILPLEKGALPAQQHWPKFTPAEMQLIKDVYLNPTTRAEYEQLEKNEPTRRYFIKIFGSASLAAGLGAYAMPGIKKPRPSPLQQKEIDAEKELYRLQNRQRPVPSGYYFYDNNVKAAPIKNEFDALENALQEIRRMAHDERVASGEPSYMDTVTSHEQWRDLHRGVHAMLCIATVISGAVATTLALPAYWNGTQTNGQRKLYDRLDSHMLNYMKNTAGRLSDGVDAFLQQIVQEMQKSQQKNRR